MSSFTQPLCSFFLFFYFFSFSFFSRVQCCFTSIETMWTVRDREPRTTTSTFTQLLRSVFQCRFTSTQTVRTIRDPRRSPRLSHSSCALFFNVALRPQRLYGPLGTQDGHVDFHTAPALCFSMSLYVHRDCTDH